MNSSTVIEHLFQLHKTLDKFIKMFWIECKPFFSRYIVAGFILYILTDFNVIITSHNSSANTDNNFVPFFNLFHNLILYSIYLFFLLFYSIFKDWE